MEALFTSTQSLLMIIFLVMAAAFLLQRVKGIKTMGPVLIVLLLGVILTNLKVVPISHELYGVVSNYFVPMSISLYLLSFDAKKLKILLTRDSLLAFASMLVSVCLVAVVGGLFFAHQIDEGMPSLLFFFAAPALMKASKWFNRVWPYQVPEKELTGEGEHVDLGKKPFTLQEVVFLLATAFTVVAVSTLLAETLLPASLQKSMRVIIITTLSLLAAQIPAVQKLNGNFDLGLLFSMVFITTIGFQVNIALFAGSALMITLFCFCVIVGSFLLHCVITRLLKVKYEFSLLAIVAGIADGTTASIVASGADWKSLVQVGMIMGVAAGAMGNYVGIGVAYLVKMLAGV